MITTLQNYKKAFDILRKDCNAPRIRNSGEGLGCGFSFLLFETFPLKFEKKPSQFEKMCNFAL
jgi:hypothetical protein